MLELRLIHEHLPRFNRQGTRSRSYPYVKLTLGERFPRLSVVRVVNDDGGLYLGPLSSTARAKRVIEAIETAVPVRRCTARSTASMRRPVCTAGQIGVAACPCSGATAEADYQRIVDRLVEGLTSRPHLLLDPLTERLHALAAQERYEEAADVRDRADALASALRRGRRFDLLRRAGRVRLRIGDDWVDLDRGLLAGSGTLGTTPSLLDTPVDAGLDPADTDGPLDVPGRREADELLCIAAWVERNAASIRLEEVQGVLADPLPAIPSFAARGDDPTRRRTARVEAGSGRERRSPVVTGRVTRRR